MSRRLNLEPLAVTCSGRVIVNLAHFDVVRSPEKLSALGASQRGRLFIGVELFPAEVREVLEHLRAGHTEATAFVTGKRQKRSQRARH